ncbi:MAG: SapC family protein [Pseudohongiellaceae bacterium]
MAATDKNPANVQTLGYARHGKLRVKQDPGFAHAKDSNIVAIVLPELGDCASNFPLAFLRNPDDQRYTLVALLGLGKGDNVYYGEQFWSSTHVPLSVQRYPFLIGFDDNAAEDNAPLVPCIMTDSALLSEKEGLALYNEEGKDSEFLQNRMRLLRTLWDGEQQTRQFINRLTELDLFVPLDIELLQQKGEARKVGGLFTIEEARLKALDAETLKSLMDSNFLAPCHMILTSLYQLRSMIRQRNRKGREQLVNFRILFRNDADQPAEAGAA